MARSRPFSASLSVRFDGGWPPEIDVMEGRGERPGDLVMTTHWRIAASGRVQSCGFDFSVPDASTQFHDYGVLWTRDRLIYFIDRRPVSDTRVPIGFDDPMYMIVNLAMGSKFFGGVGAVDAEPPRRSHSNQQDLGPTDRSMIGSRLAGKATPKRADGRSP